MSDKQSFAPIIYQQLDHETILKSTYATAKGKLLRQVGDVENWGWQTFYKSVGSNSPRDSEQERIAHFVSNSIPDFLLAEWIDTKNQLEHWLLHKDHAIRLASCFLKGTNGFLLREYDEGILNRVECEIIWLEFKQWRNLWELINVKWRKVKRAIKHKLALPFHSSLELFQELIKTELDNQFKFCLQERFEDNLKEKKQLATLIRKQIRGDSLTKQEKKCWLELQAKYHNTNPWLDLTRDILLELSGDDRFISTHIEVHNVIDNGISKLSQQLYCNPEYGRNQSRTWIDGYLFLGIWQKTARGEIKPARVNKS